MQRNSKRKKNLKNSHQGNTVKKKLDKLVLFLGQTLKKSVRPVIRR